MDKMKTMLIVDDSRTNRAILKGIFKDLYMTLEAADGLEAVELVKKYEINVIILDLNMPHMDGFEFMEILFTKQKMKMKEIKKALLPTAIFRLWSTHSTDRRRTRSKRWRWGHRTSFPNHTISRSYSTESVMSL